ncbi:uncharacterized protein EI90DRAFT_3020264 [Cantharellus anzutake]|uniref:uncharacterized protein n=1 Tax=Cantharellus anzutake TaxID=1750568 RepID=UPI001903CF84|nr:uncharacterized protein EI90DRAFT_3020264 [Cantharellus anzutake]KAF8321484.1 hypothetical protein EI90DRAFT_3020264 [Cantharellus anzutake]
MLCPPTTRQNGSPQSGPLIISDVEDQDEPSTTAPDPPPPSNRTGIRTGIKLDFPPGHSPYNSYPIACMMLLSLSGTLSSIRAFCTYTLGTANVPLQLALAVIPVFAFSSRKSYRYWPWGTLRKALQQAQQHLTTKNRWVFNASVKLGRRTRTIDDHKHLMMIISSGDVMRADAVMWAGLRRNMSISALILLFSKAATRSYSVKSFMEQEMQLGILFLRLGGNRLASIAHKALGMPVSLQAGISTEIPPISSPYSSPYILMFDEIKIEEVPRYNVVMDQIVGICCKHQAGYALQSESEHEAYRLAEGVRDGEIHLASEATIGAIGFLSSSPQIYNAHPILILPTCKHEKAGDHAELIKSVAKSCKAQLPGSLWKHHLHENGVSSVVLNGLLNPADKQDVPKALELLKAVWDLPLTEVCGNKPEWAAQRRALSMFGQLCYMLLTHPSAVLHLLLILFHANPQKGHFLLTQLYVDIQIMIKNPRWTQTLPTSTLYFSEQIDLKLLLGSFDYCGQQCKCGHLTANYSTIPFWPFGKVSISGVVLLTAWQDGALHAGTVDPNIRSRCNALPKDGTVDILSPLGELVIKMDMTSNPDVDNLEIEDREDVGDATAVYQPDVHTSGIWESTTVALTSKMSLI